MHDENNHITIPGFYDEVQNLTEAERTELNKAPFNLEEYKIDLAIADVWGEKKDIRYWKEPALLLFIAMELGRIYGRGFKNGFAI